MRGGTPGRITASAPSTFAQGNPRAGRKGWASSVKEGKEVGGIAVCCVKNCCARYRTVWS